MAEIDTNSDNALEAAIRKVLRSELGRITNEMATISQSVQDAISFANDAKTVAHDAKTLADEAKNVANEANSAASVAHIEASKCSSEISSMKVSLVKCLKDQASLYESQLRMEAFSRRNNLKFEGVPESTDEITSEKIRTILNKMGISPNVQMVACHRFGPRNQKSAKGPRCIAVKFLQYSDRIEVWSKRRSINDESPRIWIKEDYPEEIERRRKILAPYLRAAYQGDPANPVARVSAYMTLDKLVVNNQTFTHDTIDALPEYVKTRVNSPPCVKQSGDVTIFFTGQSPLSNFYESIFTQGGRRYLSVEQYLSYQKALLFDSPEVAEQIMTMRDPKLMKQKVRRPKHYDDAIWIDKAPGILRTALEAKFIQNEHLKEALLATNDTIIGEANPSDLQFGIGMSLTNKHSLDNTKWRGVNLHGETLMGVRSAIRKNEL
jgi:ribA/ribD-fused uncharacterized protein